MLKQENDMNYTRAKQNHLFILCVLIVSLMLTCLYVSNSSIVLSSFPTCTHEIESERSESIQLIQMKYFEHETEETVIYRHNTSLPRPRNYAISRNVVSFNYAEIVRDRRGLGNQIFNLAAVVYLAGISGREPVLDEAIPVDSFQLGRIFQLKLKRVPNLCPCYVFNETFALRFDERVDELDGPDNHETKNRTILLSGYYQSWKYTRFEGHLREQLQFRPRTINFCKNFLDDHIPWQQHSFTRVGIHVRRSDMLTPAHFFHGYTSPGATYYQKAMKYVMEQFERVQFVVSSEDIQWTKNFIVPEILDLEQRSRANISYFFRDDAALSLNVLSMCDHIIMSTGTFGWWAGWLAGGMTIYYSNWPRDDSYIKSLFNKDDFFPSHWIGMSD